MTPLMWQDACIKMKPPTVGNSLNRMKRPRFILSMRSSWPLKCLLMLCVRNGGVMWFQSVVGTISKVFWQSKASWLMAECSSCWVRDIIVIEQVCSHMHCKCQSECSQHTAGLCLSSDGIKCMSHILYECYFLKEIFSQWTIWQIQLIVVCGVFLQISHFSYWISS